MKISTNMDCDCGFQSRVTVRKPDHFTPSNGTFVCSACESRIQYQVVKNGPDKINIGTRLVKASDALNEMKAEK